MAHPHVHRYFQVFRFIEYKAKPEAKSGLRAICKHKLCNQHRKCNALSLNHLATMIVADSMWDEQFPFLSDLIGFCVLDE